MSWKLLASFGAFVSLALAFATSSLVRAVAAGDGLCNARERVCESTSAETDTSDREETTSASPIGLDSDASTSMAESGNAVAAVATPWSAHPSATQSFFFDGDFETGSYLPWLTPQSSNWGNPVDNANVHFGPFNVVSDIVGQGSYAGRFDLPAWSGGRTRSQVITARPIGVGTDDYYTLMFYVPKGWTPGTPAFWGVQIMEPNFEGLGGAGGPVSLQLHTDHLTLALASGVTTTTWPFSQWRSNADAPSSNLPAMYAIPPGALRQGVWSEVILHAHWATDNTGILETWYRVKGQTAWTRTVDLAGYPTLQTSGDGSLPFAQTLDVLQAYRAASTAPTTVWLDGFTRSNSFSTAAAELP